MLTEGWNLFACRSIDSFVFPSACLLARFAGRPSLDMSMVRPWCVMPIAQMGFSADFEKICEIVRKRDSKDPALGKLKVVLENLCDAKGS